MSSLLIDYAGRVHPLVVHFPIALILASACVEVLCVFRERDSLLAISRFCLFWGFVGAVIAAGSGWLFALQVHRPPELQSALFWHRWLGSATGFLSGLAWYLVTRTRGTSTPAMRWLRASIVWATAGLLAVAAHLGAALVWGLDYFS
jgi:uncharacterized membrane protein